MKKEVILHVTLHTEVFRGDHADATEQVIHAEPDTTIGELLVHLFKLDPMSGKRETIRKDDYLVIRIGEALPS